MDTDSESEDETQEDYTMEEIITARKKGRGYELVVRWERYGDAGHT